MTKRRTLDAVAGCLFMALVGTPNSGFSQQLNITNPHSGDVWYTGLFYNVTWTIDGVGQPVNVDLMQGSKVVAPLNDHPLSASKDANYGVHQWRVAADIEEGTYQVRVQTTNKKTTDLSDPFQIIAPKIANLPPDGIGLPETVDLEDLEVIPPYVILDLGKIWSTQCHEHAQKSVYRQALNTNFQCGLTGAEWHDDYQAHYDWCMQQHSSIQPGEIESRQVSMANQLNACNSTIAMRVTLTKLEVHDDCDNISDGDWYVALISAGTTADSGGDIDVWPSTSSASNVETGDTYSPNIENLLVLKGSSKLRIKVGVVDCDGSPGSWFWPLVGVPIPPIMSEISPYELSLAESVDCSGEEEVFEISGGNDFLGYELLELAPQQWQKGGNFKLIAGQEAIQACGSGGPPYTAHVTVKRVFQ